MVKYKFTSATTLLTNIHYPASYYFCSGFIPELVEEILKIINKYESNDVEIKSVNMNENTYSWLFRIFTNPIESLINPLTSTSDNKYICDYPIKIVSNNTLEDGTIVFDTGEENELV